MAYITDSTLADLRTIIKREFAEGLKGGEDSYKQVAMLVPSSTASNTYAWLSEFPELQEWVDERELKSLKEHSYRIVNKLWESTIAVKRTDIEDNNIGLLPTIARQRAEAVLDSYNRGVFDLLATGHEQACYDGQNFFDSEHPVYNSTDGTGDSTLVSNITTGRRTPWYVLANRGSFKPLILQQRIKPQIDDPKSTDNDRVFMQDVYPFGVRARHSFGYGLWQLAHRAEVELTADALDAVVENMASVKKDGDRPMGIKPTTLVVPVKLQAHARKLLLNQTNANGASNYQYKMLDLVVTNWL